ncbi:MAG: hypothetical protein Q8L30_01670 [bacterium]|nr:hypothetical protein [bacterium]
MTFSRIKELDPSSASLNSKKRAFARALRLFHEAAERVPAYKDFLKKKKVRHELVRSEADFVQVPLTDKPNYFSRYSLENLSWNGSLASSKYVSTSSGSTGVPFFWPRGEEQDVIIGLMTQHIYEDIFDAKSGTTLFVNSFSLGTWIAGIEFFNSVRWAAEHGTPITVVTPGIDKEEAVNQIKKLSPLFSKVVISGYPPFVKDILDHGIMNGVDWKKMDLKLLFAGEAVSELWKEKVLALAGRSSNDHARTTNIYGMAEAGVVAHETPVSTLLRRNLKNIAKKVTGLPDSDTVTGLYQYYPLARYFEVVSDDNLVLTANAGLPMIRYNTRDNGGIIEQDAFAGKEGRELSILAKRQGINLEKWQLPFVYLHGRKDLSVSLYALMIYNENIKYALEHSQYTRQLSGLFTMSVTHLENLDQRFEIIVELSKGVAPSTTLAEALANEIVTKICSINSEYAKLHSVIGDKAKPHITLVPQGGIQTIPGKKHKWVKRV